MTSLAYKIAGLFSNKPFVGLIDTYPGATVAYSTRKLRAAYAGACIRVRRSSDNAEQDIGFSSVADINGNYFIDETALLAFVGAGNGFVAVRYDQSGNGNNQTQATAANQAQIVSSGILITDGAKPSPLFNGTSTFYPYTGEQYSSMPGISCFSVVNLNNVGATGKAVHFISTASAGSARFTQVATNSGAGVFNTVVRRLDTDGAGQVGVSGITTGRRQVTSYTAFNTTGVVSISTNNGTESTGVIGTGLSQNIAAAACSTGGTASAGLFFPGNISEDIVYKADQVTNKSAIAANQLLAYGITP